MQRRLKRRLPFLSPMWLLPIALACATVDGAPPNAIPDYGSSFWDHWGDGRAEVATYELRIPRYGEERKGTSVAIFVTEPFSAAARVKSDRPEGPGVAQVLKLNWVKDFQTGVYDYNTMLSAFVALQTKGGLAAGRAAKVSFSSQEWCGHVYQQTIFEDDAVQFDSHSYFEGEADRRGSLPYPQDGVSEDVLPLWARGLAAPALEPGESRRVPLLLALQTARLNHRDLAWRRAELTRDRSTSTVEVPAGSFEARTYRVSIDGSEAWTFRVEDAPPHRLLRWSTADGESGELVGSERMPYWALHGTDDVDRLEGVGLRPRPARTP